MIAFPTDKGGAAIRPHDDTLDRDLSYRMQQIRKNVSSHHLLHGMFGICRFVKHIGQRTR